jgi:hypothetical protein
MNTVSIDEIVQTAKPGDCIMTSNPDGLGWLIKKFQELHGDPAFYTHIAIVTVETNLRHEPFILEAYKTLDFRPLRHYIGKPVCLLSHRDMTPTLYLKGFEEIRKDIGRKYPYRRLILYSIDTLCNRFLNMFHVKPKVFLSQWIKFSAQCAEWYAKLLVGAGLMEEWGGVDPDWFDDARQAHPDVWITKLEGILVDEKKEAKNT